MSVIRCSCFPVSSPSYAGSSSIIKLVDDSIFCVFCRFATRMFNGERLSFTSDEVFSLMIPLSRFFRFASLAWSLPRSPSCASPIRSIDLVVIVEC